MVHVGEGGQVDNRVRNVFEVKGEMQEVFCMKTYK